MNPGFAESLKYRKVVGDVAMDSLRVLANTRGLEESTIVDDMAVVEYIFIEIDKHQEYLDDPSVQTELDAAEIFKTIALLKLIDHPLAGLDEDQLIQKVVSRDDEIMRIRNQNHTIVRMTGNIYSRFIHDREYYGVPEDMIDNLTRMVAARGRVATSFEWTHNQRLYQEVYEGLYGFESSEVTVQILSKFFDVNLPEYFDDVIVSMRSAMYENMQEQKNELIHQKSYALIEEESFKDFSVFLIDLVMLGAYLEREGGI